jgi:hypothetical protein
LIEFNIAQLKKSTPLLPSSFQKSVANNEAVTSIKIHGLIIYGQSENNLFVWDLNGISLDKNSNNDLKIISALAK